MTSHASPSAGSRWAPLPGYRAAMFAAPAYFCVYLTYLFWHRESEVGHWLSLVLLPMLIVWALHRASGGTLRGALASLGLGEVRWTRGLLTAVLLGAVLGLFQVLASRSAETVKAAFATGRAAWLLPVAFLVMLLTAGFTEELFFRGFLQTRLEGLLRSRVGGLLLASFCFGVYHLPYAYFNPRWPSAGHWGQAWGAALGQGIPGGLILGALYLYSGRNLLAPAVLHALVDAFPAMGMLHFGSR
jgi:membrane protease YdiL (CAAX protease family)